MPTRLLLNQRQVDEYMKKRGFSALWSGGYVDGWNDYESEAEAWANARADLDRAQNNNETPAWYTYQSN